MSEVNKAFVIGGFSEDLDFLWGLTNEISRGEHASFDDADSLTWADVHNDYENFAKEARNRAVIGHSGATLHFAGIEAPIAIAIAGVEPTPLHKSVTGAFAVAFNKEIGHDEGVKKTGLTNGFVEVAKHPSSLRIPFRIRKFSTVEMLKAKATDFPAGRFYLPARDDEFGFGDDQKIKDAYWSGINASYLGRWHNSALLQPKQAAKSLNNRLNS